MSSNCFENIIVDVPFQKIYARLGYSKAATKIDQKRLEEVEKHIQEAVGLIRLQGAETRIPIDDREGARVKLAQGSILESKSLVELFQGCKEVLFMGATAGHAIAEEISRNSSGGDMTKAVIYDAVASEMVDDALSWIIDFVSRELRRESKCVTKMRFSAGYGDFALENQKIMHAILEMDRLGVALTENYILIPEKSVTAVAGIQAIQ